MIAATDGAASLPPPAVGAGTGMRYRQLGRSGLRVSEIGLGSWLTYGWHVERERAVPCIRRAFELGINFLDTANVYGRGACESFLGEALRGVPRDSYVIATKVFFAMSDTDRGLSAAQIHKQIDASLRRLRTDYVDLYQCHRFDPDTPLEETMAALTEVVRQGKARYIGFSEWTPAQIRAAAAIPNVVRFVSSQPQYSMLWRAPEAEVIPLCEELGIGQIVWSPLSQGVLTGKYLPGKPLPPESRGATSVGGTSPAGSFLYRRFLEPRVLEIVQRLRPLAAEAGLTLAQLAIAWILRQPGVASAIIGATRVEQIEENARAAGVTLDPSLVRAVEDVLSSLHAGS
ncbi:aldo/keto reductase [Sorangium cellulosum So0157-2]|uniref:Aldo/keto reductase n=2 Tax=Sorangium cellulosum TaxID=56 RepID=S4XIM0_SORCE|nr:aldo/keto reductase family protein [Sorangium cellulosum]AGP32401.1 aldo/keto reductase [Sorangium cellulosum So0157-2]